LNQYGGGAMSEQVSTFMDVDVGVKKYMFFIVTWNDYVTQLGEELDKQFVAFGEDLGTTGSVIKAYKSAARESFQEVVEKSWPVEIKKRLEKEQDPFMIVIKRNFQDFEPELDHWGIVWFSQFLDKPGSIYRLFGALARKTRQGEDVLEYLKAVSLKEKYKKLGKYFKLKKPELFGVSVDVEAIIDDLIGIQSNEDC
jgi:hypothetical protein